jgi:hypothetical protein
MATLPMALRGSYIFFVDMYLILLDPFKDFPWPNELGTDVYLKLEAVPGNRLNHHLSMSIHTSIQPVFNASQTS